MTNLPAIIAKSNTNIITNSKSFLVTKTPTAYNTTALIHSIIFNFNNFVCDFDVDQFLVDPEILP